MNKRLLLGMLTPSSNTVLEPITSAMLADLPDVTAHFGRFRVTEISMSENALGLFDPEPLIAAAELLTDAKVDVISWNGTSAGWLGFNTDKMDWDIEGVVEMGVEIKTETTMGKDFTIASLFSEGMETVFFSAIVLLLRPRPLRSQRRLRADPECRRPSCRGAAPHDGARRCATGPRKWP